jgi:hypothetical protein
VTTSTRNCPLHNRTKLAYTTPQLHLHQPVVCAPAITDRWSHWTTEMTCSKTGEHPRGTQHDAIRAGSFEWRLQLDSWLTTPTRLSTRIMKHQALAQQPSDNTITHDPQNQIRPPICRLGPMHIQCSLNDLGLTTHNASADRSAKLT